MTAQTCTSISATSKMADFSNPWKALLHNCRLVVSSVRKHLEDRKQHRISRDAFNNLLTLDDRTLKDIGVTRGQVEWASKLPKNLDAARELELLKLQHRA